MVIKPFATGKSPIWMFAMAALFCIPAHNALANNDHCGSWPPPQNALLQTMQICAEPPIARRLGNVCTEVRWLCSDHVIEAWIDQLMTQSANEWFVHRIDKGLVFAQWSIDPNASMGIFWSPSNTALPANESGLRIMVSRLKAVNGDDLKMLGQ